VLALCEAHLGIGQEPTLNTRLIADGLATDDLVPIVMMFTLTVPRRGGEDESVKDVERYEAVRKKFFHVKKDTIYWGRIKNEFHILSFVRVTDVTYQLFGGMSGPHHHGHGLLFGLMSRVQWEEFCRDGRAKARFEDEISQAFCEEWQRAAANVDPEIKILKPYRDHGKLTGGVVVEMARDLNQASQYVAKNLAFEVAYSVGKIPNADDKHNWGSLLDICSAKDLNGKFMFAENVRVKAAYWFSFHASQAHRDQRTVGNIFGNVTLSTYYLGTKEERKQEKKEEKQQEDAKTSYTHSSFRGAYNSVTKLEVEESVDVYEEGADIDKITKIWTKEERTQEAIGDRIVDNEKIVQEKAAFTRWKKGCRTELTVAAALEWCVRYYGCVNKSAAERYLAKLGRERGWHGNSKTFMT
jgi:hypothetical protein